MAISDTDFSQIADADAQLQQELCSLFAVDTQSYLQRYYQITQQLQASEWRSDIQELYRCIHTVKGGAVTIGAKAVLQVATVLEDVLADLRYLETAPDLSDGDLCQTLAECGELLTASLELQQADDTEAFLSRMQQLHQGVRARYLPQWNEIKQMQQEFATQGFDLLVLELEIALEQLPLQGTVPATTLQTAHCVLAQLQQITPELQLASGWTDLLEQAQTLFSQPMNATWRSQWLSLFQALKTCAKQGGEPVPFEFEQPAEICSPDTQSELDALDWADMIPLIDLGDWLDTLPPTDRPQMGADAVPTATQPAVAPAPPLPEQAIEVPEVVQVPVALEKLDQSAQSLTETLLALRTLQGCYQTLQTQITQLVALAQEGAQHITQLRQIQDDYALLDQLRDKTATKLQTPMLERYRQGYSSINRLLETSLRLAEMGAETDKTSQQMTTSLQRLNRTAGKLQTTIEDSRLIPFRNLSFRAKAILRDLMTRYPKSVQLRVQGEQTELDVSVARKLEPAMLHLIRNAFDHGLELADDRVAQGKPEQGTLILSLQRQGNWFQLQVQDDGRGIDPSAVQARAEALGLPLTQTQTAADLLAVICQPGFSSQTQVNEISGRGIGMDVVAAQIAHLHGQLNLQTTPGQGTTFQLKFPVPRLLVPCVLLQADHQVFAIPNDEIRSMTLFDRLQATRNPDPTLPGTWIAPSVTGSTPILDLRQYWHAGISDRSIGETAICLSIAGTAAQSDVWLLADDLLEQTELMIHPLPAPLIAPPGLMGVSLQANGCLIPVLEARPTVNQLLSTEVADPVIPSSFQAIRAEADVLAPMILIVDDAALMRRRLESSLTASGYLTHTCQDGQDAWNWLQAHPQPDLIITDIEMPNMDGFTLVDLCRTTGISVPILVVSSRLSEEWFTEAKRLGVNDYLTKGFSTVELIKKINTLLNLQD